jgi:hypothetical protein
MAAFQVSINGRFWVSPEAQRGQETLGVWAQVEVLNHDSDVRGIFSRESQQSTVYGSSRLLGYAIDVAVLRTPTHGTTIGMCEMGPM